MRRVAAHRQRGQALTEFLVAALVLIPLFLLVPMIAKYQDIASATQMASRYVAFEAMAHNDSLNAWKPEAQLADEVRRRFFSNPSAPIKTSDEAGDFKANQNLFWRDPQDQPLIRSFDNDIQVSFGTTAAPTHQNAFGNASDEDPYLQRAALSLKARGTYTAGVTVKLASLPAGISAYEPFDQLQLQMTRRTSLLVDHWTGRDPSDVQSHIDNIEVNAGLALKPIAPVTDVAVVAAELPPWGDVPGPKLGQLGFWKDKVPADRVSK